MLGSNFRKIRLERGVTLKAVAGNVTSVASISKFETGSSDLGVRKLTACLHNMNTSFLEYSSLSDQSMGNANSFVFRSITAYRKRDSVALARLINEQEERYRRSGTEVDFNDLIAAVGLYYKLSARNVATPAEVQHLEGELSGLKMWSEGEIIVFGTGMNLLPSVMVTKFGADLHAHVEEIHRWNGGLYQDAWSALLNAVDLLLTRHSPQVRPLLTAIDRGDLPTAIMINQLRLNFLKACYAVQRRPTKGNVAVVQRDIDFLTFVGSPHLRDQYVHSAHRLLGAKYPLKGA